LLVNFVKIRINFIFRLVRAKNLYFSLIILAIFLKILKVNFSFFWVFSFLFTKLTFSLEILRFWKCLNGLSWFFFDEVRGLPTSLETSTLYRKKSYPRLFSKVLIKSCRIDSNQEYFFIFFHHLFIFGARNWFAWNRFFLYNLPEE
jgi:hypothetical protein